MRASANLHPDTLKALNGLAVVYFSTNRIADSLAANEQLVASSREAFGSDHPTTKLNIQNLAYVYETVRRFDQAIELYEELVESAETPDQTVAAISSLGRLMARSIRWSFPWPGSRPPP